MALLSSQAMSSPAPAATRTLILDASIRLMQHRGYRAVGMREIAGRVEIKAASLYHHFASKEVLAAEAMARYCEIQQQRLQALSARPRFDTRLVGYAALFGEMLSDGPRLCLYSVLAQAHDALTPPCAQALEAFCVQNVRWLQATLHEGLQAAGEADAAATARELAELIFGAFEGYMVQAMVEAEPARAFRRRAQALLKRLLPALMQPASPAAGRRRPAPR